MTSTSQRLNSARLSRLRYLPLALILVTGWGCQNASIVMKPDRLTTYGTVNPQTGEAADERAAFTAADPQVVAWASFSQSHGEHTCRFKWYNPEGHFVMDSGPIAINPDDRLYDWRGVWSTLPLKDTPAALMPGRWKVFVFQDEKKIGTIRFDVRPE